MYAGPFNQNIWLRQMFRDDLVDAYERRCRNIVNEYEGRDMNDGTLRELMRRLNDELCELAEIAIEERCKRNGQCD